MKSRFNFSLLSKQGDNYYANIFYFEGRKSKKVNVVLEKLHNSELAEFIVESLEFILEDSVINVYCF